MSNKTGGFSSVTTLFSALWVSIGTRGTYEVIDLRYPMVTLRVHPSQPCVLATVDKPDLYVVFLPAVDPALRRSWPPVPSEGKMRVASPASQPDSRPRGAVTRLLCVASSAVELVVQLERNVRATEMHHALLRIEFTSLRLEPRTLTPRP